MPSVSPARLIRSGYRLIDQERGHVPVRALFATHDEACAVLFDYLAFCNHRRHHSALGYVSPAAHERRHHDQPALRLAA